MRQEQVYRTRDGRIFTNSDEAEEHEKALYWEWAKTVNLSEVLEGLNDEKEDECYSSDWERVFDTTFSYFKGLPCTE